MQILQAISTRRSIRNFKNQHVARELIEQVLIAGVLAPSGKNRQPWHFTVLLGEKKTTLVDILESTVSHLKEQGLQTGSAEWTAKAMRQAPVCIVVHNPYASAEDDDNGANRYWSLVDTQSIGAAIQNMLLQAEALNLGTLWICDVFYAEQQINNFLGRNDEMIAAIALGYADAAPAARPRRALSEVTTWL
ncbi:MAG: putative NAD(P)H nitroreductase YdjA [Firmicutes bacterium]|nr:putative NAD(P)H nitroreductase YdjA [candidate division NPL-UPA2 bacterium]MBT9153759.1 putative NAD(P)H nitroreductase YdjA [candidate division NPL-UPA2 bacterium]